MKKSKEWGKITGYAVLFAVLSILIVSTSAEVAQANLEAGREVDITTLDKSLNTPREVLSASPQGEEVDIVLVIDRSGSMGDYWKGEMKLTSAKEAAEALINVLPSTHRLAVVSFATDATLDISLTTDFEEVKTTIDGLSAYGYTNVGAAFENALGEIEAHSDSSALRNIIFLTDGYITEGMSESEVMAGPVQEAVNEGIVVYTIGFGDPADLRENFLRNIAETTGGKYYYAEAGFDLQNSFIITGEEASGLDIKATFEGEIAQGETKTAGSVDVVSGTEKMRVILNWPGSDLDLTLITPGGEEINSTSQNVVYSGSDSKPEYYDISSPTSGNWDIKVYGKSITATNENYYVIVSETVGEAGLDLTLILVIVGIVVTVVVVAVVCVLVLRKGSKH